MVWSGDHSINLAVLLQPLDLVKHLVIVFLQLRQLSELTGMHFFTHMLHRQVFLQDFTIDCELIFSKVKTLFFLFKNVTYALGLQVFAELVACSGFIQLSLPLIILVLHMLQGGLK